VRRYNPWWVLVCSTVSFNLLFMTIILQFLIFTGCISCITSSSQFIFGLPLNLEDIGLHRVIFFVSLSSYILSTCPSALICLNIYFYLSDCFTCVYFFIVQICKITGSSNEDKERTRKPSSSALSSMLNPAYDLKFLSFSL
jgi:hypothetical protein